MKKQWHPEDAQKWTWEDYLAMVFSVLAYFGLGVGVPIAFFHWSGYILLLVGLASTIVMIYVIEPKLRAVSSDFESKQQQYLEELQRIVSWEE